MDAFEWFVDNAIQQTATEFNVSRALRQGVRGPGGATVDRLLKNSDHRVVQPELGTGTFTEAIRDDCRPSGADAWRTGCSRTTSGSGRRWRRWSRRPRRSSGTRRGHSSRPSSRSLSTRNASSTAGSTDRGSDRVVRDHVGHYSEIWGTACNRPHPTSLTLWGSLVAVVTQRRIVVTVYRVDSTPLCGRTRTDSQQSTRYLLHPRSANL